ncbi:beta-N-acetylhexosaminidase [Methylophaga frappieri]
MSLGPLMLDIAGTALTAEEKERLQHPLVGGVILFTRNYQSPEQIAALTDQIHALRQPHLLIAVDHEGGRVQRFRDGFTRLPPMAAIGKHLLAHPQHALKLAQTAGWLMAAELRAVGVDFSFAPVLDLDYGVSEVIGDRSFHPDPDAASKLAGAFVQGLKAAWMSAVGKHFPGHGAVTVDSHQGLPIDERPFDTLWQQDMVPFRRLSPVLAGVMPAHIVYRDCDTQPAGFSRYWIQDVLRKKIGFQGAVFSDDLSMNGAAIAGDVLARAEAALAAGCDMALVCNDPTAAAQVLDGLQCAPDPLRQMRLLRLHGRHPQSWQSLQASTEWQQAVNLMTDLHPPAEPQRTLV